MPRLVYQFFNEHNQFEQQDTGNFALVEQVLGEIALRSRNKRKGSMFKSENDQNFEYGWKQFQLEYASFDQKYFRSKMKVNLESSPFAAAI